MKKIVDLIKNGKFATADDVNLVNHSDGPVSINSIEFWGPWSKEVSGVRHGNKGGLSIHWRKPGVGFGMIDFVLKDGKLTCHCETMSRGFVAEVLRELLDESVFDSGPDEGELRCCVDSCSELATHRVGFNRYCQVHAEECSR